jgi:hypothetical protein
MIKLIGKIGLNSVVKIYFQGKNSKNKNRRFLALGSFSDLIIGSFLESFKMGL